MRRTVASSSPTKMLFATRQSSPRASRPARAQPSTYFGQCVLTTQGWTKLAEMGAQPRSAAAAMTFEWGRMAVTTIGGYGFWNVLSSPAVPKTRWGVRAVVGRQALANRRVGGVLAPPG